MLRILVRLAPLAVLSIALSACASAIDSFDTEDFNLSKADLKAATEEVMKADDWTIMRSRSEDTTDAAMILKNGHRTDVVINYVEVKDGVSRATFDGESTGDLNWLTLGILGLANKDQSVQIVTKLIDQINAKVKGG